MGCFVVVVRVSVGSGSSSRAGSSSWSCSSGGGSFSGFFGGVRIHIYVIIIMGVSLARAVTAQVIVHSVIIFFVGCVSVRNVDVWFMVV